MRPRAKAFSAPLRDPPNRIRPQCEALMLGHGPRRLVEQCPSPAIKQIDGRYVCWVHAEAMSHRKVEFLVRPGDSCVT